MKDIPVAISNISRGCYSALESKGLCGIYVRQALRGGGELDIWCGFFLAEVCFLWGQSTTIYLFCFLFWKHMLILWCPKSLSISFDLFIQIWLNIYIWPHWHGKAFIFLSRLNQYICYQLSHGKTVMENKHVLIHLVCKVSTYTSEHCWSMNETLLEHSITTILLSIPSLAVAEWRAPALIFALHL